MDIILHVDIIVDIGAKREPYFSESERAYKLAQSHDFRIWIYVGCLQTLFTRLSNEIQEIRKNKEQQISKQSARLYAKKFLHEFSKRVNYLSALSEDGDVFEDGNPIINQLSKALDRLGQNAILLTRDEELLNSQEKAAISVEKFIEAFSPKNGQCSPLPFIDLAAQQNVLRSKLERNIHKVLYHGQYILGPEVRKLEKNLANFAGVKHAITCASGTDALLMALMAFNVGPGDAVFTTPFTFIATAEVIALLGATPIFVDIDARTFNIDPVKLGSKIQQVKSEEKYHLRGIIPVDLFGLPADYDEIMSIAKEENLFVLEDAAQGFGAIYKGRRAGSLAHVAATSFFPAKPLGCYGDGGAIFTDDDDLADIIFSIRVHGKGSHKYENIRVGVNGRLDTLQAAILIPKLDLFSDELKRRQQIAQVYSEEIENSASKLECPFIPPDVESAWAQYSLLSDERDLIMEGLNSEGIPSVVYYPIPLHLQPAFSNLGYRRSDFPVAETISHRIFSLPMSPYLTKDKLKRITKVLNGLNI